jgi:hypothetical protein
MAKDKWSKGRLGKIKNSPAAKMLKGAGKYTAEVLGLVEDRPEGAPQPNEHGPAVQSRTDHFKAGMNSGNATFKVPAENLEADQHFEAQGLGIGSEGNVTSIRRGIALKGERMARKPEGY